MFRNLSLRNKMLVVMLASALAQFKSAFRKTGAEVTPEEFANYRRELDDYYQGDFIHSLNQKLLRPITPERFWPENRTAITLQYRYIAGNPHKPGEKGMLDASSANAVYDKTHARFHERFRHIIRKFEFHDLYLVDVNTGNVVYSVAKEIDFATNLLEGPYKNTNLGAAFRAARHANNVDFVKMVDFQEFAPSYSVPMSFIAAPVFSGFDKVGVLIVKVGVNELDNIMTSHHQWQASGLGKTGETYLIGADYKMRSNSRFLVSDPTHFFTNLKTHHTDPHIVERIKKIGTTILLLDSRTPVAEKAVTSGLEGSGLGEDYRGVPVLVAYAPIDVLGVRWYMFSEIEETEAFRHVARLRGLYWLYGAGLTLLLIGLTIVFTRTIARPVAGVQHIMREIALGALPAKLDVKSRDEVGAMMNVANELIDGTKAAIQFAKKIESGDLNAEFIPRSEKDAMGLALVHMRDGLKEADSQIRQSLEESMAQEEELRQNAEELFAINEELSNKQHELRQKNELLHQNEEQLERKVEDRTKALTLKNQEMTDSIVYGGRLQTALMPYPGELRTFFPDAFILFRPQNIVSGDFYWFHKIGNKVYFAVMDCTGHGIPGCIISVIGLNALSHLVDRNDEPFEPAEALTHLEVEVEMSLNRNTVDWKNRDGMDVALCRLDLDTLELQYATAVRSLILFSGNEIKELRGNNRPIGSVHHVPEPFINHSIQLKRGDKVYLFSDGYADQFGGPDDKKFMMRRFKHLLWEHRYLPMEDQCRLLEQTFVEWKGRGEQTDDVLVMGLTVPL